MYNENNTQQQVLRGVDQLLAVMARLRDPQQGCPWDLKQSMQSLVPYTIEEAYEVAAAIADLGAVEEGSNQTERAALQGELGDLLFQVVFYAQLGKESQWFDFDDIAQAMAEKLIRRHPHVFGSETVSDAHEVKQRWEALKRSEREEKGGNETVFADVPNNLPAILKAMKIQKRAASVGFDWHTIAPVLEKIEEELAEVREALTETEININHVEEEIGDLLFAVVNLARHAKVNPETALARTNQKFMRRFGHVESAVAQGAGNFDHYSLEQLEAFWQQAKKKE
ncbi:nucleoside triphosphate pyrophosphohydrolase [Aliidiomarina celeris]|uniref:nucleoside triphosphate pyrophosphohydrolase n=1 Tax=Aliidiomarina celeris TaxID=2249428 RepID=UPI0018E633A4|nr:nucleoside triphosphate pyrophosphohydrolase [Aliidiomarina celeris]